MFKNRDFEIAYNHLQSSIQESQKASEEILKNLNSAMEMVKNKDYENLEKLLIKSIENLQFQDILAQRLKKVQDFLKNVDSIIETEKDKKKLDEFAWENEVVQEDVDDILKSHGL